jgi:hypothetical protein
MRAGVGKFRGDTPLAYVLLSYAAEGESAAIELTNFIQKAGYPVGYAKQNGPSFHEFRSPIYVVVIWSAAAVASPYVYEQARAALKANRLVQVIVAGLDPAQIPAVFRHHGLIPIASPEQILSILPPPQDDLHFASFKRGSAGGSASYSDEIADRVGAAVPESRARKISPYLTPKETPALPQPRRSEQHKGTLLPPIPRHLSKAAVDKQAGRLAHKIPDAMRVEITEGVEVRLSQAHQEVVRRLRTEELPIVETMTVNLYGAPDAFNIVALSRETQLVIGGMISSRFQEQRFGRWQWHVTPKKTGTHKLLMKVSADLSDSRGVPTSESCQDRVFEVWVRMNYARASIRVLKWAATGTAGMLLAGLIGAYTQDVWWPKVKALLASIAMVS